MELLHEYMRELSSRPPLREDEERELWRSYKEGGDLEGRYRLIEAYQQLVVRVATGCAGASPVAMDLIQEGTIGLIEAVEAFDPARNVPFGGYAYHRIRGRILNYFARQRHDLPADLAWDAGIEGELCACSDEGQNPEAQAERGDLAGRLRAVVDRLSAKEARVVNEVILADRTPVAVAAEMNISQSYLYKLEKRAIQRMRGMLSRFVAELRTSV